MNSTKYVVFNDETFFIFASKSCLSHLESAALKQAVTQKKEVTKPTSAGSCYLSDCEENLVFYGKSISLALSSKESDSFINDHLGESTQVFLPRKCGLVNFDCWLLTNDSEFISNIEKLSELGCLIKKLPDKAFSTDSAASSRFFPDVWGL